MSFVNTAAPTPARFGSTRSVTLRGTVSFRFTTPFKANLRTGFRTSCISTAGIRLGVCGLRCDPPSPPSPPSRLAKCRRDCFYESINSFGASSPPFSSASKKLPSPHSPTAAITNHDTRNSCRKCVDDVETNHRRSPRIYVYQDVMTVYVEMILL